MPYCQISGGNGDHIKVNIKSGSDYEPGGNGQAIIFTVLHGRERDIQPELLEWSTRFVDVGERTITPERVNELDSGAQVLSVFRAAHFPRFPYKFGNYICETADDQNATLAINDPYLMQGL